MHLALEAIWLMLGAANRYFSAQQPWVLRKSESEADQVRFATVLYATCEAVRIAALLIQPVMPESAGKLLDLLSQPENQRTFAAVGYPLAPGTVLPRPPACSRATRRSEFSCIFGEAHMDGHAALVVSVSHGMSAALGAVERQRNGTAFADEVAPPRLGVR